MKNIFNIIVCVSIVVLLTSCNDFLDREPLTQVTPEAYLNEESHLAAFSSRLYTDVFPSYHNGLGFESDRHTDNMADKYFDNRFVPGEWRVPQSGGSWEFTKIYSCNYFLDDVIPKWENNEISGSDENINHYIGEIYFIRAYEYFKKLQEFGDFPIISAILTDDKSMLIEASKRQPRNEVARFIISDLDKAIELLKNDSPDGNKNRISRYTALLFKSRVALFEGTWLKYFKGTAFVPNGDGWAGKQKDYNTDYKFPSGDIDSEIDYFLEQSIKSSSLVADNIPLVENTGKLQQSITDSPNPYMDMFSAEDMSGYSEVLLWRQYNKGLGITHGTAHFAQRGNNGVGMTRGYVDSYLMSNGLPIYAEESGYLGDNTLSYVRKNRDDRLNLFLKEPNQINVLFESSEGTHSTPIEPIPDVTEGNAAWGYITGYSIRKFNNYDAKHGGNWLSYTGCVIFRASEAYLNYIEAYYEKEGQLDGKAQQYWQALRVRANVNPDFNKTILATNMTEESYNDWGAFSSGNLVDETLYNIRRERRSEFLSEGLRYMDLKRWRSMDQMVVEPYHIEGFKLWGDMKDWYDKVDGGTKLLYGLDNSSSNVSPPDRSDYLRPYEISSKSLVLNGYEWTRAHYLSPIAIQHFLITSEGNDASTSPIYQNPFWPIKANEGPIM